MSGIEIGLAALSTGITALSAIGQANTARSNADYNQRLADYNAAIARGSTAAEVENARLSHIRLLGAQKAAYASGGVDVGTGSPLDIAGETAAQAEHDILTIKYRGKLAEQGAQMAGGVAGFQGQAAQTAAYLTGGSRIVNGLSSLAYGRALARSSTAAGFRSSIEDI